MGDPTGLAGALVAKLLDQVIQETKTTVNCMKYLEALKRFLESICPLISAANTAIQLNKSVVEAGTWLVDVEGVLNEAQSILQKWIQEKPSRYDFWSRNRFSKSVMKITEKLRDLSMTQAPWAILNVTGSILEAIKPMSENLDKLTLELKKKDVGDMTNIALTKDIDLSEASQTIKNSVDIFSSHVLSTNHPESQTSASTRSYASCQDLPRVVPDLKFIFGVDVPLAELKKLLLDEKSGWVGVWGRGGIGKTLLAELGYNSKEVKDNFEKRFWLTVGSEPSIESLENKLFDELKIPIPGPHESRDDIKARLSQALGKQKVLLVIDDVWDAKDLKWFDVNFGSEGLGSKILLTTRNWKVLKQRYVDEESILKMEGLSDEDSWKVFRQYAFGGVKIPSLLPEDLVTKVKNECKGVPLCLKVIGSALAGEKNVQPWRVALVQLKEAETLDPELEDELYKRLQLSYDALEKLEPDPKHRGRLQKCFIYFAAFPEDYDVSVDTLVDLWDGEKLLDTLEEDGNDPGPDGDYVLGVLTGRSLIELRPERKCRIHDEIRNLILHLVSQKKSIINCLFKAGKGLKEFPETWLTPEASSLDSHVTHLSLNCNEALESLPAKVVGPGLEVLLIAECDSFMVEVPPGFLESFTRLKVLDFHGTHIESLPESVANLTNLLYLDLSDTALRALPRGLGKLEKLESLNLTGCRFLQPWPFDVSCLKSLLSLYTWGCPRVWKPKSKPADDREDTLENGSCSDEVVSFWDELVNLSSITTLTSLSIERQSRALQCKDYSYFHHHLTKLPGEMESLINLRALTISCDQLVTLPLELKGVDGLPQWSKLTYLSLNDCISLREVPSWVDSLPELVALNLKGCTKLTSLPDLHKLPRLEYLCLGHCINLKCLPVGFSSNGAFPALKVLDMSRVDMNGCPDLHKLPRLEELYLRNCRNVNLPLGFSSNGAFPALKVLDMSGVDMSGYPHEFPSIEVGAFKELTHLNLSNSMLKVVPPSLILLPKLVRLDLLDNESFEESHDIGLTFSHEVNILVDSRPIRPI